jgi:glutamyl-tRNA synthetase
MSVVVRFAPSPTGFLHIGGARTALFNYLFAKHHHGKFLLRIEDTDKARSTQQAIDVILEGLAWLGLSYDEKPVLQSQNQARHQQVAKQLLEADKAYLCYTSVEELEERRNQAESKGEVFRFQSIWRNKVMSQHSVVQPVLRIKAPQEGFSTISDLVQGKVSVANSELDDLILLRSDQVPTYMFAVVVDDYDMKITHIIRGNDHFTNAFRQQVIYQALNWRVPQFAHIPLIHGADGAKLSKRHGATSVLEYKEQGYLPQALRNYLLRLGWSCGNHEIISDENAIAWFDIENIGKSPARFDFAKLNHLNNHYLKNHHEQALLNLITPFLPKKPNQQEEQKFLSVLKFAKEKTAVLTELADICAIYYTHNKCQINQDDSALLANKQEILQQLKQVFSQINNWQLAEIKQSFDDFSVKTNLKIKDFGIALRIALTFSSASAGGIFEILDILGKEEVLFRLNNTISTN